MQPPKLTELKVGSEPHLSSQHPFDHEILQFWNSHSEKIQCPSFALPMSLLYLGTPAWGETKRSMGKGRPAHTAQIHFQIQIKIPIFFEGLVLPHSQMNHVRHKLYLYCENMWKCWCLEWLLHVAAICSRGQVIPIMKMEKKSGPTHQSAVWGRELTSKPSLQWVLERLSKALAFQRHNCQRYDYCFGHPDQTSNHHLAICENLTYKSIFHHIPFTQSSKFSRPWWDNLNTTMAPGRGQ